VIISSRKIHVDKLPIKAYSTYIKFLSVQENEIYYAIESNQTTVIVAETGSGKTTRKAL